MNKYISIAFLTLLVNLVMASVSLEIKNVDTDAGILDIYMINSEEVGGFQFELLGINITGASTPAGFFVSTSSTTILAFSLTGATIPAGEGILTQVSFSESEGESICFGEDTGSSGGTAISDVSGNYIAANWGDCFQVDDCEYDECGVCDGDGSSCGESTISLEIQNVDISTGTLDIYMINTEEVGGFQFQLTNIEITGAYGGVAQDSGFILNTSGTDTPSGISKVLGFSLTGATIPVGEGVLTTVTFTDFNNENICFGEDTGSAGMNAIASATGGYIAADWGECYTDDCEGIYDCLGVCGGDAELDECGGCDGPGAIYECGCNGLPDGECDCAGNVADCVGECGGIAEQDECGVCNGDGSTCEDFGGVSLEIQNVNIDAGTLDIVLTSIPACSYCEDSSYNNNNIDWQEKKLLCELQSTWVAYDPITEEECANIPSLFGNGGWWYDGHVGGFQFELLGITIDDATAPNGFTVVTTPTIVIGFSLTGATIPPGIGILLTTISFDVTDDYAENGICFGEDTGSAGNTAIGDASGYYLDTEWGECHCSDDSPADICGVCGGDGYAEGKCDCEGNTDEGCGCGDPEIGRAHV